MRTRRARKSIEQWSELVEQFDCGSDSMELFCQQQDLACLLYTSPSPRDRQKSRMPSSA